MSDPTADDDPPTLRISTSRRTPVLALRLPGQDPVVPGGDLAPQRGTDLPARVAAFLAEHGSTARQLGRVAVDVGPGSYTGLRVAVTFARFIGEFTAARLETFTSLELLAAGAWRSGQADDLGVDRLQVVLDARRGRLHTGLVERRDDRVRLVDAPRAVGLGDFVAEAPLLVEPTVLEALRDHPAAADRPLVPIQEPTADELFDPRLQPRAAEPEGIEPLYLMGTYADD